MQAPREASVVEMGDTPTSAQYHGVRWDGPKERWRAEITLRANGRVVLLGLFSDAVAAARAVDDAASVLVADGMVHPVLSRSTLTKLVIVFGLVNKIGFSTKRNILRQDSE